MILPGYQYHRILDLRGARRAYAVGDIHGEFPLLEEELRKIGFDPTLDRLVSVGDLIDRGPHSEQAVEYLSYDWFDAAKGNHDEFPQGYLTDRFDRWMLSKCGCDWYLDKPKAEIQQLANVLEQLPYCITVYTPGGRNVGIAHADCHHDWLEQVRTVDKVWMRDMTVQSRDRITKLFESAKTKVPLDIEDYRVANIDHVVHGHSVIAQAFTIANRTYIDTGAYMGGELTIVDLDTL
jgi:serine/threonine protein phosphatase 1